MFFSPSGNAPYPCSFGFFHFNGHIPRNIRHHVFRAMPRSRSHIKHFMKWREPALQPIINSLVLRYPRPDMPVVGKLLQYLPPNSPVQQHGKGAQYAGTPVNIEKIPLLAQLSGIEGFSVISHIKQFPPWIMHEILKLRSHPLQPLHIQTGVILQNQDDLPVFMLQGILQCPGMGKNTPCRSRTRSGPVSCSGSKPGMGKVSGKLRPAHGRNTVYLFDGNHSLQMVHQFFPSFRTPVQINDEDGVYLLP